MASEDEGHHDLKWCYKAIEGVEKKPIGSSKAKYDEMEAKTLSTIQLYLLNEVLREVVN